MENNINFQNFSRLIFLLFLSFPRTATAQFQNNTGSSDELLDSTAKASWRSDSLGVNGERKDTYKKYFYKDPERLSTFFANKDPEFVENVFGKPNRIIELKPPSYEYIYQVSTRDGGQNAAPILEWTLEILFTESRVQYAAFYIID